MKKKTVAAFLVCGEKKGITADQAKYLIPGPGQVQRAKKHKGCGPPA